MYLVTKRSILYIQKSVEQLADKKKQTHNIIAKTNHRCEAFHSKQSWLGDKRECRKSWEVGIYTHAPLHERCMQLNVMWHHRLPPANSIHHGKLYQWVSVPTSTPQSFSANLPFQTALSRAYNLDAITWYPNCNSCTKSCTKHFGNNIFFLWLFYVNTGRMVLPRISWKM